MKTLPELLRDMWGYRAPMVADQYRSMLMDNPLVASDLAVFCNAAAPIAGPTEFDRGVEEGKRRVWLHVARSADLRPDDFIKISNGEEP